jgi:cell division protein ZapA
MNKVKITVCGKEYKLSTETSELELRAVAAQTERTITEFMNTGRLSVQDASVLAALDAYAEAEKQNRSVDNIRIQIQEYVSDAAKSRSEIEEAVREKEKLRKKHAEIAKKIDALDLQIDELKKDIDVRDIRLAEYEIEKSELKKLIAEKDEEIKKRNERIDVLEKENEDLWKFKLEENT